MLKVSKSLLFLSAFIAVFVIFFISAPKKSFAVLGSELLTSPWILKANRNSQEKYQLVDPNALINKTNLRLTYNLNGTCLLGGDASALVFDQPFGKTWRYISLSKYGKNCAKGEQTVDIPLSQFIGLDLRRPVGTFHVRIWHYKPYKIEIKSAFLYNPRTDLVVQSTSFGILLDNFNQAKKIGGPPETVNISPKLTPSPTPTIYLTYTPYPSPTVTLPLTPTPTILPIDTTNASWSIQSVSSMKETKDRICNQASQSYIENWVNSAFELGINYIAIETPYENPSCGNSLAYTDSWLKFIRQKQLKVWHRHMPLAFEGIYDVPKNPQLDYLKIIYEYIVANKNFFAEGDIFTPVPEPQNGGILGVNYCARAICQFNSAAHFNSWLRSAMDTAENAFSAIGLKGKIKIGYFGFDGFIAWGDNNPDWNGILEDSTVLKMGNLTIDHYPEIVGDTMNNDLNELETRYPNIPIIIGEWGTITGGDTELQVNTTMRAAKRHSVVGFNYWHLGAGGNEALITDQFAKNIQYDDVQKFFKYADTL